MTKLQRNLSGRELATKLALLGYELIRQTGSHMRYRTARNGDHSITIVDERPLNTKTLSRLLKDIAAHHGLKPDELKDILFSK
ncbi:MAG: type II toxin-antitoxin system HicA family toxin [bacterium]|nr:type II toxin-antitoxin system HicA family toxin [bacterium]